MGKLLPIRHPNRDFFIVDVSDANPRDDMASMEHPVFSLSPKPDHRELEYTASDGKRLRVVPSGKGLATIFDKDIVLYCISKLVAQKDAGEEISAEVELAAHEVMQACNWRTNAPTYKRFEDALIRLRGTTIVTDIKTGGEIVSQGFGLIDAFEVQRKDKDGEKSPFGRMTKVKLRLSEWTFNAINAMEVLSISPVYFQLRKPMERRLYELARKHVGQKSGPWKIGIEKLRNKVGTSAPLKKFRFNLREIIRDDNIPDYRLALSPDGKMVEMWRTGAMALPEAVPVIPVRPDTMDKAQALAQELRLTASDLYREWCEYCHKTGEALKSPDAAFIAFCKQKKGSAPGHKMTAALGEASQLGLALDDVVRKSRR
ncbi:MAG: replication initiator protein A [Pseudomonadota bacterium]